MRQYVKLGVAAVVTAVALLGGASTASAYSDPDPNSDLTDVCEDEAGSEITCQIGEGNESVIINQTNNISVGDILDEDLDDVVLVPELE